MDNESKNGTITSVKNENAHFVKAKPSKRIVSTIFDTCFTPCKHEIDIQNYYSPEDIRAISSGEKPWAQTTVSKPYWVKDRDYDELDVSIYGALGNTDDRHLLDYMIAAGEPLKQKSIQQATMRDVLWSWERLSAETQNKTSEFGTRDEAYLQSNLPVSIPEDYLSLSTVNNLDSCVFSDNYIYLVIEVTTILALLGKGPGIENKRKLLSVLDKLSLIEFRATPLKDGGSIPQLDQVKIKLLDNNYYTFCDTSNIRNKGALNKNSFNHIVVGIGSQYYMSLKQDASIPREKLIKKFMGLKNKNHVIDFIKFLESNRTGFFHNRSLKKLIGEYYNSKVMILSKQNADRVLNNRINATYKALCE